MKKKHQVNLLIDRTNRFLPLTKHETHSGWIIVVKNSVERPIKDDDEIGQFQLVDTTS